MTLAVTVRTTIDPLLPDWTDLTHHKLCIIHTVQQVSYNRNEASVNYVVAVHIGQSQRNHVIPRARNDVMNI